MKKVIWEVTPSFFEELLEGYKRDLKDLKTHISKNKINEYDGDIFCNIPLKKENIELSIRWKPCIKNEKVINW